MWMSQHFVKIVWCIIAFWALVDLLGFFSVSMLVSAYIIPVFMEQTRSNIISSFSHMKIPGAYRPFETTDNTNNHIIIGFLSMGFGWHNAHHYNARELINTHRWWELDIEGLIGKLLSKKTWQ
jgi:stearoyl-CoA desaturase (delta-9 desaturase)